MNIQEVAPPTKKHERMVKHIKKSYKKDGKLTDDEKSIAYATAWKNYNKEDWKPEIEHSKLGDAVKKKAEKKRKEAESSLPPHLRLDAMKKAFAHTNESVVLDANTKIKKDEKKKKMEAELRRLLKHAIAVKRGQAESFEIDKAAHKKVQKKAKLRNLAKGNMNPNEKAAAEKKAGGPKLYGEGQELKEYSPNVTYQAKGGKKSGKLGKSSVYSLRDKDESKKDFRKSHVKDIKDGLLKKEELAFEGWQERAKEAMRKVAGKKPPKKHDYGRDAGKVARELMRKKDHQTVNFLDPDD